MAEQALSYSPALCEGVSMASSFLPTYAGFFDAPRAGSRVRTRRLAAFVNFRGSAA